MNKPTEIKKRFTGIGIGLFEIRANNFDGYGISILSIKIVWTKNVTMSSIVPLMYFNFYKNHERGGIELCLFAGILWLRGKVWSKVIKKKTDFCENCGAVCQTREFYKNDIPFCDEFCKGEHNNVN